jgi:hypothetical protein
MPDRHAFLTKSEFRPEVIVDFDCHDGMLFISLKNIGNRSAYRVVTRFDKPLHALGGQKCISDLQLFRKIDFIPPSKEFSQFLDPVTTWLKQRRSTRVGITINYRDREGQRFTERITHDLAIYRDLGQIHSRWTGGADVPSRKS